MNILAIGNSFSQDATAYLHQMAEACGATAQVANLYVPGCSLESHWKFVQNGDEPAYDLEENGAKTGRKISLRAALGLRRWDVITLQQCSPLCGVRSSYTPYLPLLCGFCRALSPGSRLYLHETWAYETDSTHSAFAQYGSSQTRMADQVQEAYARIAAELGLPCIPVGRVVRYFRESVPGYAVAQGGRRLTRDGYHLSIPLGRLLAALVWIEALAGRDVSGIGYVPPEASEEEARCVPELSEAVHWYMAQSR